MRARRIGVLLQSGNLLPHLTVRHEHPARPAAPVRRAGPRAPAELLTRSGWPGRRGRAGPRSCPAASWRGPAWPSPWPTPRTCCWPTSRPANSTGDRAAVVLDLLRAQAEPAEAVLVVTHSAAAWRIADRVVACAGRSA